MTRLYFTSLIAFFVTALLLHALRPIALKIGLVDHPNIRKHHRGMVPLIGGIGIAAGFCIGILALDISLSTYRSLLAAYLWLVIIGVMDDFNELTPKFRIIAQVIVALLITCWGNAVLTHLGHLMNSTIDIDLKLWAIPFTLLAVIALINANNMLDGMNGLAGGSSFVTLVCLAWIAIRSHATNDIQMLFVILSCTFAFLCFNFPILRYRKRLVFLGDAGSTGLGLMMGWFGIKLAQFPFTFLKPAYLLWLFILPIFDLTSATFRRLLIKRTSPLCADREHIHHLLAQLGLRNSFVTLTLTLFALAGGLAAIFMAEYQFPESTATGIFCILFLMYFISANIFWHKKKPKENL